MFQKRKETSPSRQIEDVTFYGGRDRRPAFSSIFAGFEDDAINEFYQQITSGSSNRNVVVCLDSSKNESCSHILEQLLDLFEDWKLDRAIFSKTDTVVKKEDLKNLFSELYFYGYKNPFTAGHHINNYKDKLKNYLILNERSKLLDVELVFVFTDHILLESSLRSFINDLSFEDFKKYFSERLNFVTKHELSHASRTLTEQKHSEYRKSKIFRRRLIAYAVSLADSLILYKMMYSFLESSYSLVFMVSLLSTLAQAIYVGKYILMLDIYLPSEYKTSAEEAKANEEAKKETSIFFTFTSELEDFYHFFREFIFYLSEKAQNNSQ